MAYLTGLLRKSSYSIRGINIDYLLYIRIVKSNPKSRRGRKNRLGLITKLPGDNYSLLLFRPRLRSI